MSILEELSSIGSSVDPVIREYLLRGSSEEFREILLHQVEAGGKRFRPALVMLACEAAGGTKDSALRVAAAMELVHNYSLIFDDIIDRGELRRGKPTTRKKYGDAMALLAALHYREAIDQAIDEGPRPTELHELICGTIKKLVEGERVDVLYEQAGRDDDYVKRTRLAEPSWDTYERIVTNKTASLMAACAEAGAMVAGASGGVREALGLYGGKAGEAFQIMDDLLDIFGEETKLGKRVGKDIEEHKLGNAVILLALEELDREGGRQLLAILRKKRSSRRDVSRAIRLLEATGCKERALALARERVEMAKRALGALPDSEAKRKLIAMAEAFVSREF